MLLSLLRIHGHSMQPSILEGQKVLASSFPYLFSKPKKNDIVVFKTGNKVFVKRISSISGDKYFLTGDNKGDSLDSRKLGEIDRENILAKIIWH